MKTGRDAHCLEFSKPPRKKALRVYYSTCQNSWIWRWSAGSVSPLDFVRFLKLYLTYMFQKLGSEKQKEGALFQNGENKHSGWRVFPLYHGLESTELFTDINLVARWRYASSWILRIAFVRSRARLIGLGFAKSSWPPARHLSGGHSYTGLACTHLSVASV